MEHIIEQFISWDKIGKHERSEYTYTLGKAVMSKDRQTLTVNMELNFVIPHGDLAPLKQEIKSKVPGIKEVRFAFHYRDMVLTQQEQIALYIPYLVEEANGEYAAMTRTILTNEFVLNEDELVLYALGDVVVSRLNEHVASIFEKILSENMQIKRKIRFENHEEQYEKAKMQKNALDSQELSEIQKKTVQANPKASPTSNPKSGGRGSVMKPVKGQVARLVDITPESGSVVIEGELFKKNHKTIKSGRKLVSLLVTDKTTSICVKAFLTDDKWEDLNENVREGDFVRIQGEAEWDTFDHVTVLSLKAIEKGQAHVREDNAEKRRVELHAHTKMSAMDGLNEVEDMIKLAASWKQKAIAITDHGVVQAFPEAAKAVEKNRLDIKVVYGVEAYFFDDTNHINEDGTIDYKTPQTNHIILLARTQKGLKNLYKLISISHLEYFYKRPRIPKSILHAHREGLLIGSACEAGEVYSAILEKKDEKTLERIAEFYDYLEIQPLINNRFLIDNNTVANTEELKVNNKKIVALGEKLGKPVVATCDAHYANPEDSLYRKIIMAGQGYKDIEGDKGLHLRTTEEMLEEFKYLGEEKAHEVVIEAPNMIADMIEAIKPVPDGKYPPKIQDADERLRAKCMEKAWDIYGKPLPQDIADRLERELDSVINNGYAVMYVSAEMLVQKSLDDGYLVGSRGSVGSSFAATMAGITEVNPLPAHYICPDCKHFEWGDGEKYECGVDMDEKNCPACSTQMNQDGFMIPFETFLGFEGDKEPDIDLNFAGEYQPNAHKYVEEIFGKNNVFRAGTIGTIAEKTAFGFVKKYFEEREIPANKWEADRLTLCCAGVRRTTGQHPGGVIIVPDGHEIFEFCPVQRPANDITTDVITTHFDYHAIDKNLFKLDILGHDVPSMIRHLQDMTGVDPLSLPLKDEKVNSIFNGIEGLGIKDPDYKYTHGSYGIPEFGTRFVRQMLDDTKPQKFADLVKISGCSHGTNVWVNNALDYIKSGIATMDEIISTRDDIMRYLILKGLPNKVAFKIMESVRKGMGVNEEDAKLMRENGVPEWYIESCRKIEYMFPRAHAVAYVMMSYRIAYYKVYYPAPFYAVYFTTKVNNFDADTILKGPRAILDKIASIEIKGRGATQKEEDEATVLEVAYEMYSRGFEFLPARLENAQASKFKVVDGKVLLPLSALTGLGETAARAIAEEYEKKPFDTIEELKERTRANKTAIEALRVHGALEGLPESDQLSLF
ncbi:MAG: PolC-type DNA polymerase III [Clostridiales bacterium]|nr:PolC-type DNA polymerase III [Clostridiales bacterium]